MSVSFHLQSNNNKKCSLLMQEGTTKVVFAYHTEDPKSENDFKQHKFRGSRSILLLNNMDKKQINETGWKNFVVNNRNVR